MNKVYWFTGLSASGKTTLSLALEKWMSNCIILDGDQLRKGLSADLGFSVADRNENIRRVAWLSKMLYERGMNVVTAFISPMKKSRDFARSLVGKDFIEIYLSTSLEVCESRDPKGLYKKARQGIIKDFTGIDSPYEAPENPEFVFDTGEMTVDQIINTIVVKTRLNIDENTEAFNSSAKTSLMIGRWQPLHDGHKKLIQRVIDEGNNVIVGIRNPPLTESDPFSVEDRIKMIKDAFGDSVRYVVLPEGSGGFEVAHGRKVGWGIREIRLNEDIEQISGTNTRRQMGIS